MTLAPHDQPDVPVWARHDAFPIAPSGCGWLDFKKLAHTCDSPESLITAIRDDKGDGVELVWLPEYSHLILPEEVPQAAVAVLAARLRRSSDHLIDAREKLRWFGFLLTGVALYMCYQGWAFAPVSATTTARLGFALHAMITSMSIGITVLMFLVFAFIPWYQAQKRLRGLNALDSARENPSLVPTLRFETWLARQKAPVTRLFLVLISLVALAQIFSHVKTTGWGTWMTLFHNWDGTAAAGLVKDQYLHGQWWRLFTAPFLHGNVVHFLMNASALAYLGKRMEVFARWPHLPLVFLFAASIGGEASARFIQAPSVGASGGLMGWLGFLLVFESLHSRLVPSPAKRRLLAGVLLTALIGLIGYRFIDNAAHLGGLCAGALYALIVFPKSPSPKRPVSTLTDLIAGSSAMAILILSALLAVTHILTN